METLGNALVGIVGIILIALIMALPLMWLWNWLMPMIFDLMELNFWQSLGLAVLSSILFKSSNSK